VHRVLFCVHTPAPPYVHSAALVRCCAPMLQAMESVAQREAQGGKEEEPECEDREEEKEVRTGS